MINEMYIDSIAEFEKTADARQSETSGSKRFTNEKLEVFNENPPAPYDKPVEFPFADPSNVRNNLVSQNQTINNLI